MSIINLQDYKQYSGITNISQDATLQYLVDFANGFIQEYCGCSFAEEVVLGRRATAERNMIILPEYPILSVEEIRYLHKGVSIYTVPTEDFLLDAPTGIIELLGKLPSTNERYNVSIDFTHGYSSAPTPLKIGAFELITYFNKREFNQARGTSGGDTTTFIDPKVLPVQIRATLDMYRVV